MSKDIVELLENVVLTKEGCLPIHLEKGTLLKILMRTPQKLIVSNDHMFNFTISLNEQNKVWRLL